MPDPIKPPDLDQSGNPLSSPITNRPPDLDSSGKAINTQPANYGAQPLESPDSFLRSLWTKSVFGVEEPTMEDWTQRPANAAMRAGIHGMTTPFALAGELGAGLGGYALGRLTRGAKTLSKIPEVIPSLAKATTPGVDRAILAKAKDVVTRYYKGEMPAHLTTDEDIISFAEAISPSFAKSQKASNRFAPKIATSVEDIKPEEILAKPQNKAIPELAKPIEAAPELASPVRQAIPEFETPSLPSPPKVTSEAQAYIEGIKSGVIPKGTSFDKWKTLGEPSLAERLIKEESGTYEPGKILSALKGRKEDKKITNLRNEIIETLIKGGEIRLNEIFDRAKSVGITRQKFNKVVDGIIDSDEIKSAIRAMQDEFKSIADPVSKFKEAIKINIPLREEQEALYSAEKSQRIARFSSVKERGMVGFAQRMKALGGEYEKIKPSPLQLDQVDQDKLIDHIVDSRLITEFEKGRAGVALQKVLSGSELPQKNELALLDRVFGPDTSSLIMELHGGLGVPGLMKVQLGKLAGTLKTLKTLGDVSGSFRQGAGVAGRREFFKNYVDMWKMGGSQRFFDDVMKEIHERPTYLKGREYGLDIIDDFTYKKGKLVDREEAFMDSYINDIRHLGESGSVGNKLARIGTEPAAASERAYVGFLNRSRQDAFDSLYKEMSELGYDEKKFGPALANTINILTGRGKLGPLEKYSNELNFVLFSPKMMSSRLQMLTALANPQLFWNQPWPIKREILRGLASYGAIIGTLNGLAYVAGAKLTGNPLSSDFLKPSLSRTRVDPGAGHLQYITAMARYLKNSYTTIGGETREYGKGINRTWAGAHFGLLDRYPSFMENKSSPLMVLVRDLLTRYDMNGNPLTPNRFTIDALSPIIVENLYELHQEDPKAFPFPKELLGILELHGLGVNTYEERNNAPNVPRMPSARMPSIPRP